MEKMLRKYVDVAILLVTISNTLWYLYYVYKGYSYSWVVFTACILGITLLFVEHDKKGAL